MRRHMSLQSFGLMCFLKGPTEVEMQRADVMATLNTLVEQLGKGAITSKCTFLLFKMKTLPFHCQYTVN